MTLSQILSGVRRSMYKHAGWGNAGRALYSVRGERWIFLKILLQKVARCHLTWSRSVTGLPRQSRLKTSGPRTERGPCCGVVWPTVSAFWVGCLWCRHALSTWCPLLSERTTAPTQPQRPSCGLYEATLALLSCRSVSAPRELYCVGSRGPPGWA